MTMKNDNIKTSFSSLLLYILCYVLHIHRGEASHRVFTDLQSEKTTVVAGLHRSGYHFQPLRNWINDPNGPMYYKGLYHFFYQYNPEGAVWGNIVWAHSISTDLINWVALEPAIWPSASFDIGGCWSGSATVLPGKGPVILYTGVDQDKRQVQNYAVPEDLSDPYLRRWIKPDDNPIIVPDRETNISQFRDPTTAWKGRDGQWRIIIGAQRKHRPLEGTSFLYKSRDFINWEKTTHLIHSAPTGMWECPDLYPVSLRRGLNPSINGGKIKHVLKASLDRTRYDYYTLGTYLTHKDRYVPDNASDDSWTGLRYDYGNFYASKSFFDSKKGRRVLWGWANESDTPYDDAKKGWAGIQLIPRTVVLDWNERQLRQWPVEELESLRSREFRLRNRKLYPGETTEIRGITAAQADVEVSFTFRSLEKARKLERKWVNALDLCEAVGTENDGGIGPFGLLTLASRGLEEYTPVFFRIFRAHDSERHVILMCSDARKSTLRTTGVYRPSFAGFVDADLSSRRRLSLRSLIDNSVVESFGEKGKTCITSRVYPTLAVGKAAHLFVFNNGSEHITVDSLKAWNMNRPVLMNQNPVL